MPSIFYNIAHPARSPLTLERAAYQNVPYQPNGARRSSLSGASHLFHVIFLELETLIMEGILRPQMSSFDDAAALAIAETSFLDIKGPTSLSPDGPLLPLRFCIPRLLRNAELVSSACAESAAHPYPVNYFGDGQELSTPVLSTHYFIQQIVLAHDCPKLRDAMFARLRTAPTERINHQEQVVSFLVCDSDWIYQHQHCILQISAA
jgi:hypothetical protein